MSAEYPGLPRVARGYWHDYLVAFIGLGVFFLFTGAVGALVVLAFFSEAVWLYLLGALSFILHLAGFTVKDVWKGDYEPTQTTFSSTIQLLVLVIISGTYQTTVLLIGTALGYAAFTILGLPVILAAAFAAYYPVIDVVLTRRISYTPGYLAMLLTVVTIDTVLNLHRSLIESIPVVGKRKRPQS